MNNRTKQDSNSGSEQTTAWLAWQQTNWSEEAGNWVDDQLAGASRRRTGEVEIMHQRPWSSFAQVPTNQGLIYLKAPAPTVLSELRLTEALSRWRPDCTVPLLATDEDRGWMLSVHAGVTLREVTRTPEQLTHWEVVLPLYAELQRQMTDRVAELLALGVTDRRLSVLPEKYEQLLQDTENLYIGLPHGLTVEEHKRLLLLRSRFEAQCRELSSANVEETLTHEEITEVNVILGEDGYRFTDWDNGVSHPFFSLLTTLGSIAHWIKPSPNEKQLERLRDIYLEHWNDRASRSELLELFAISQRLAMVNRSLSYYQTFASMPERYKIKYDGIPGWLRDFLEAEDAVQ